MTVDIIVPTCNRAALLPGALESVQCQSFTDWHCWVAEDGETSETSRALKPFLKDDRFSYLPGKHAGTPAVPRNRAILQGSGEYIAFLDDDDRWLPHKLEKQLEFLAENQDCVLLGTNAYRWPGQGNQAKLPLFFERAPFGEVTYEELVEENFFINSSVIMPRRVLEKAGLLDEQLLPVVGEDYSFWLRAGVFGKLWLLKDPLLLYRMVPAEKFSSSDRRFKYEARARIYESALRGVPQVASPLSRPEYKRQAAACRRRMEFYQAGPGLKGKITYHLKNSARAFFALGR